MTPEDDGFLSRWSRRKATARSGPLPAEPGPAPASVAEMAAAPATAPSPRQPSAQRAGLPTEPHAPSTAQLQPAAPDARAQPVPPPQAPTLDDVQQLPADAPDFSRFVARGVQPDVRNAALKKLFSDPHFNVMDGLDIYIDDYGKPDPLPLSMLRQMTGNAFLGFLQDEEAPPADNAHPVPGDAAGAGADHPGDAPAQSAVSLDVADTDTPRLPVADAAPVAETAPAPALELPLNEDADLRLQPHDAAGRPGDPAGPLEATDRAH
jgi:hypothetical protein